MWKALFGHTQPRRRRVDTHDQVTMQRQRYQRALTASDFAAAHAALDMLERLEPGRGRWPLKRGDLLRREGQVAQAHHAYLQAAHRYAGKGLKDRARAMESLASTLKATPIIHSCPPRSDVIAQSVILDSLPCERSSRRAS